MAQKTFIVLQRDFTATKPEEQFSLSTIKAKDKETAWEKVEFRSGTECQDWLMTKEEFKALKKSLSRKI